MDLSEFKKELLFLNNYIYFDAAENLREKTNNPTKLKQMISNAECLLKDTSNNKDEFYFLRGTLGNLYRIYGSPKAAIPLLESNLKFSIKEENKVREITSLIPLGEALKYDEQHAKALDLFEQALVKCIDYHVKAYLDFAFQHKGKCLLELNRTEEALNCFQEALGLRKAKGDASLITSTELAIN